MGIGSLRDGLERGEGAKLVGLGDSLTYGWMVSRGYYDRFVDWLEDRFGGAVLESRNEGVPGDTSRGGLYRLERIMTRSPDLVVVQFGINDLWCSVPVSAFETNLREIVARIGDGGAIAVLVTSCPLPDDSSRPHADPYFDAIRAVAQRARAPIADTERAWRESAALDSMRLGDGVHPDDRGHELMASALRALFE